tara:strand:+ start:2036 stop:2863 length:828 start_codon:yes stop_codon:yes gene_type:complete
MDKINITYNCNYCNRKYKIKTCYDKHVNICRLLNNDAFKLKDVSESKSKSKSKSESHFDFDFDFEERDNTPSKREMWQIILHQTSELKKLKKEIDKLKQRDYYHIKKISVIDYLNTNYKPKINYEDWVKNINITQDDLNFIFEYGSIKGIVLILKNFSLKGTEADLDLDSKNIPIISTNHTLGKLYIYSNDCWNVMNDEQFKNLLQTINKKIFNEFEKWRVECEKNMNKEKYSELYTLYVNKIVSGKYSNQQIQTRIKNGMYNFLRINLDNKKIE